MTRHNLGPGMSPQVVRNPAGRASGQARVLPRLVEPGNSFRVRRSAATLRHQSEEHPRRDFPRLLEPQMLGVLGLEYAPQLLGEANNSASRDSIEAISNATIRQRSDQFARILAETARS